MTTTNYPLATFTWDEAEQAALQRVINSNIFTMGAEVRRFEEQFAEFMNVPYALMVNSGSSSNLLMIAALFFTQENALKPGDEVIVPAVSWSTTYTPLQQYGLHVKFVDIDADTLNYDLEALEQAITDKTRVLFCVNLLGNPNDFSRIERMIAGRNITLIEDNCESLGATFNGQQAGTFGVMGSYSSFFSHHISTIEGGLITVKDEELYHILLSLRSHGWTRHLPKQNRLTGTKSDDPFEESFKFILPGFNVRPCEINGALGQEQLKKVPAIIRERRNNAARFQERFANHPLVSIQQEIGESSWFGYSFVIRPEAELDRAKVLRALSEANIDFRPIVAGNFTKNPVIKYFDYSIHGELPNAELIDRAGFFVGNHHYPIPEMLDLLESTLSPERLIKSSAVPVGAGV